MAWLRRLFSRDSDEAIGVQKLSGGDEDREVEDTIGSKLIEFAEASKETLKKTLTKGGEALKGAAGKVHQNAVSLQQKAKKGRRRKRDSELLDDDGELTLLSLQDNDDDNLGGRGNDVDDGIDRLDADEERPF